MGIYIERESLRIPRGRHDILSLPVQKSRGLCVNLSQSESARDGCQSRSPVANREVRLPIMNKYIRHENRQRHT